MEAISLQQTFRPTEAETATGMMLQLVAGKNDPSQSQNPRLWEHLGSNLELVHGSPEPLQKDTIVEAGVRKKEREENPQFEPETGDFITGLRR